MRSTYVVTCVVSAAGPLLVVVVALGVLVPAPAVVLVALGIYCRPFIIAWTGMPSPTLIQSSCTVRWLVSVNRQVCNEQRRPAWEGCTYQDEVRVPPVQPRADLCLRRDRRGRVRNVRGVSVGDQDARKIRVEEVVDQNHPAVRRSPAWAIDGALGESRVGSTSGEMIPSQ